MSNVCYKLTIALLLPALLSFTPGLAAAAENTIEEIIVTADFRARSELDMATSVTVMTEAVIKSRSAQHFE